MATFSDLESQASVRLKINAAITKVDDAYAIGNLTARRFNTVQDLLDYTATPRLTVGSYVEAGGFRYLVVSSGEHVTTDGGDKLTVVEEGADTRAFGATADWNGSSGTDDTAAIQAMVDAFGYFRLPIGRSKITDTITIPDGIYGQIWSGQGKEESGLHCVGMTGKNAIEPASSTGLIRVNFRDFSITGDCDTSIDLTTSGEYYASSISNLLLNGVAGPALYIPSGFSYTIQDCQFYSTNNHAVELDGGPGTNLIGCYAHQCGTGKAGYRIYSEANLIGCNGLDSGSIWGMFGRATAAGDAVDAQYYINIVGGNLEDWGTHAIELRYTGRLTLDGPSFVSKATGTFETYIKHVSGAAQWDFYAIGCKDAGKGSTMTGASKILANAAVGHIETTKFFTDYYRTDQALLYNANLKTSTNPAFQVTAWKVPRLDFDRAYGYVLQVPSTWTANATNMSVSSRNTIQTANTLATNMNYASGGEVGQILTIIIGDANTTIVHNFAASGRFLNTSGANITAASGNVFQYVHNGTNWVQI